MTISRKTGTYALAAAATFATMVAFTPTDASAQYRRGYAGRAPVAGAFRGYRGGYYRGGYRGYRGGAAAAGIIGGLALGALAAGAMAPGPVYAAPVYGAPAYGVYGGACEIHRERYWDGWGWRVRRVRVCD